MLRHSAAKIFTAAICLLTILVLSGCGAAEPYEMDYAAFDQPFVLTAEYTVGHLSGELVYRENAPENFSLEYLSPESVGSLTLTGMDGKVKSEFLGIVTTAPLAELSPDHPLAAISGCIARFRAECPEPHTGEGGRREYTLSDGCKLVFVNGVLWAAELPARGLTLKVTGFDV